MANKKQLAILKQGVDAWNKWRQEIFTDEMLDRMRSALKGKDHGQTNLKRPDLSGVDLSRTNLSGMDLNGADLRGATLRGTILRDADLAEANLSKADLIGANLLRTTLRKTDLSGATLRGAQLGEADLSGAYLIGADVREAHLREADLREADLSWANLIGAEMIGAKFVGADFLQVNLSEAILAATVFGDVDLSTVKGLDKVRHYGPSIVGIDTIYKSKGNIPEVFLRGCGVPENFITYMHSLTGKAFDFYSCFISHSAKDKSFCERLRNDLQAKGVRTWYFPKDAKWGETVWGEIDRGIKIYDKLVVVCSKNSLQSEPVVREIERSLAREDKEGRSILFPIRIDNYVFARDENGNEIWRHPRAADLRAKVVGDFSGRKRSTAKYREAFDKLLKALQKE